MAENSASQYKDSSNISTIVIHDKKSDDGEPISVTDTFERKATDVVVSSLPSDSTVASGIPSTLPSGVPSGVRHLRVVRINSGGLCSHGSCTSQTVTPVTLKSCKGCGVSYYCGRECQKKDWISLHKRLCPKYNVGKKVVDSVIITRTIDKWRSIFSAVAELPAEHPVYSLFRERKAWFEIDVPHHHADRADAESRLLYNMTSDSKESIIGFQYVINLNHRLVDDLSHFARKTGFSVRPCIVKSKDVPWFPSAISAVDMVQSIPIIIIIKVAFCVSVPWLPDSEDQIGRSVGYLIVPPHTSE